MKNDKIWKKTGLNVIEWKKIGWAINRIQESGMEKKYK